jgi:hypothetical protein
MLVNSSRTHNISTPQSSSHLLRPSSSNSSFSQLSQHSQLHHDNSSLPSPPHHSSNDLSGRALFNHLPHASAEPSPSDLNGKELQGFFNHHSGSDRNQFIDTSNIPISSIDQYMANGFDFPPSQVTGYPFHGLPDATESLTLWDLGGGNIGNGVANSIESISRNQQGTAGQSRPSSASMPSRPAPSPQHRHRTAAAQPAAIAGRGLRVNDQPTAKPTNLRQGRPREQSSARNHLPTPSQTPTQDSFFASSNNAGSQQLTPEKNNFNNAVAAASQAMNSALLDAAAAAAQHSDDAPGMSHSGRPSFSSIGHEPATPMGSIRDLNNQHGIKASHNGEIPIPSKDVEAWLQDYLLSVYDSDSNTRSMVPKLERTVTDAINDELYMPSAMPAMNSVSNHGYLVPQTNPMVNDRLHAAQMARSNSSQSSQSQGLSPYRPTSPWVAGSKLNPGNQLRQQQQQMEGPSLQDLSYQTSPQSDSEPKTISPQEAMLDYKPSPNELPLFPPSSSTYAQHNIMASSSGAQQYPTTTMAFGNIGATTVGWNPALQSMTTAPMQSFNNFLAPSTQMGSFPMSAPFGSPHITRQMEHTPEFPAHLTSMDSSASEAAPPSSIASTMTGTSPKPVDSSAHTGAFSCTYHGCSERFPSAQKLQKHKRDAHRRNSGVTPGVGSGMTSAQLMERNSQTGPHKCMRENPTTNKPCNLIFSRPYDLTRHEDTIHNSKKMKSQCALCQPKKEFSRSDALTRHMRVVHPEVDFPGKHRRRGGASP